MLTTYNSDQKKKKNKKLKRLSPPRMFVCRCDYKQCTDTASAHTHTHMAKEAAPYGCAVGGVVAFMWAPLFALGTFTFKSYEPIIFVVNTNIHNP